MTIINSPATLKGVCHRRAVGITATAQMQRKGEVEGLNVRDVFVEEREDYEEDLQEEVLKPTGRIINTGRTYSPKK